MRESKDSTGTLSTMSFVQRTHACGSLRSDLVGRKVTLNGWVHRIRNLGGLYFLDLRDRSGIVQLILEPSLFTDLDELKVESCLSVTGEVHLREEHNRNPKTPTGEIEVVVSSYSNLGPAKQIPFQVADEEQMLTVGEERRIRYRYLDLRRPSMLRKLQVRASAVRRIRAFLDARDFIEIETPIITKSTPEGARDYLVPYRLNPGQFYALPQSPQQYKQLLMVAGIERYYQIAKCFRDESQRADRQPEFTQLDLEMSFVNQEDVLTLAEELTLSVCNGIIEEFNLDKEPVAAFERLTYDEAVHLYGCDKPDLRFGLRLFDVTTTLKETAFGVFQGVMSAGGQVRGVRYPGGGGMSRKEIGELETFCREFGAKGMAWLAVDSADAVGEHALKLANGWGIRGSFAKFLQVSEAEAIVKRAEAEPGDLLCFIADSYMAANNVLFRLRNEIGNRCGLRDPRILKFVWILDFPLVEWNEEEHRWDATHHLFTSPKDADLIYIDSDPARIRSDCYDIVCNGTEWASGSIRIHRADVQRRICTLLGIDDATQQERFGHMIEAFEFGAPPHGGIAPGIDRLVMLLLNEQNIREVIAFPKIGLGTDPLMGAPSTIDATQWKEIGLQITDKSTPDPDRTQQA